VAVTLAIPFTLLGRLFHFEPLPWPFFFLIGGIVFLYVTGAEITKRVFYRRMSG
jgi:Mg2+-importing ATPase